MQEHNQPVTLIGNVGSQPEMRFTPSGKPVTNFNFAVHAGKDQDGNNLTSWFRVTCWNPLAELVSESVTKGDRLKLGGQLRPEPRIWKDEKGKIIISDKDNLPIASYEFTAFQIVFLTREYSETNIEDKKESVINS